MTDQDLRLLLRSLGIDGRSWKVVAMLPMVQVAWSDGAVHEAERRRILEIAGRCGAVEGDGRMVLEGWLRFRPAPATLARGLRALQELARRGGLRECGLGKADLLDCCEQVAKASGGLFGVLASVGADERATLAVLREQLSDEEGQGWRPLDEDEDPHSPFDEDDEVTEVVLRALEEIPRAGRAGPSEVPPPRLVFTSGRPRPPLALVSPTVIGRRADCTLALPDDASLSRQHCNLHEHDGRWYVVDLGSANGTFVDEERVLERRLFGGETLRLGSLRAVVELEAR